MLSQTLSHFPTGISPGSSPLWENLLPTERQQARSGGAHGNQLGAVRLAISFPPFRGNNTNRPLCAAGLITAESKHPTPTCSRIANALRNQTHTILLPHVPALGRRCRLQNLGDSSWSSKDRMTFPGRTGVWKDWEWPFSSSFVHKLQWPDTAWWTLKLHTVYIPEWHRRRGCCTCFLSCDNL